MIDLCTESDVEGCPEGVSGTVLALRALEPFAGIAEFLPAEPGEGYSYASPECPSVPAEEGKAYFGVSTNRPAVITMRYRSLEWSRGAYAFPETTFTLTTPDSAEGPWNDWLADDSAGDRDDRAWINHCYTLDLPPRDDYIAFFSYQDKYDSSVTATNWGRVDFFVPTTGGIEPQSQRRPTAMFPVGIDELYVSATHEREQMFRTVAIPGTDVGVCSIAGDDYAIGRRDGVTIDGAVFGGDRTASTIDPSITRDPAYPYFPTYTEVATDRLFLRSGTDYVVCNYWLDDGPAFDRRPVREVETALVSTPEAYIPTVIIRGLTDLYRDPTEVLVSIPNCGSKTFDLSADGAIVTDRTGARISLQTPETLCTLDTGLGEIDRRGLRVDTVVNTDVERQRGSAYIRTNLECGPGPCNAIRFSEMVLVPLARIASDGSECPSDPFTGCLSGSAYPAGKAIVELAFNDTLAGGNGLDSWNIGAAEPFDDAPRELPENPQYDISIAYDYVDSNPTNGGAATLIIIADRPVSMQITNVEYFEGPQGRCSLAAPAAPTPSAAMSTVHTFDLTPLCLGARYRVTIEGLDAAGNMGEFVGPMFGRDPSTPPNQVDLFVPLARLSTSIDVAVNAPDNELGHTAYVYPVTIRSGDVFGRYPNRLGWTWSTTDRAREARDGWSMFGVDGRANACGEPGAGELNVQARRTATAIPLRSGASVALEDIDVQLVVEIFTNHRPGGIYGQCAVNSSVARYELNRVVTLGDLLAGIEITSDDGAVVFTLETTRSGPLNR
jgi:hypothetical protein